MTGTNPENNSEPKDNIENPKPKLPKFKYSSQRNKFESGILKESVYAIQNNALPFDYDGDLLLTKFKHYYPEQWETVERITQKCKNHTEALLLAGEKPSKKFDFNDAEEYFFSINVVKYILSDEFQFKHQKKFYRTKFSKKLSNFNARFKRRKERERIKREVSTSVDNND